MIECTKYKSVNKGTLLGYADFFVDKMGLEIYGCQLHMKDGKRWLNFPSKEYKNEAGEIKYMPTIKFRNKDHFELFCKQAKEAIEKKCAEAPAYVAPKSEEDCPF